MYINEILRKAQKGTKLYSPIFGVCELSRVFSNRIEVKVGGMTTRYFSPSGRFLHRDQHGGYVAYGLDGECLLFPSKENRDWSTFKPTYRFHPFEKVLVRNARDEEWHCAFFSHVCGLDCMTTDGCLYDIENCLPYHGNDGKLGKITED